MMCCRWLLRGWPGMFAAVFLTTALANETSPAEAVIPASEPRFGLGVHYDHEYQRFDETHATIDTVSVAPWVRWSDVVVSLDLPWQEVDGEYYVNGSQANAPRICEQLASLTPLQLQIFINRREKGQTLVDYCAQFNVSTLHDSASGWGDAGIVVSRGLFLDRKRVWYGVMTLGYTDDNGDWEQGLGSGTQDVLMEFMLNGDSGQAYVSVIGGYQKIVGGDLEDAYNNYGYVQIDTALHCNAFIDLGAFTEWQQAASDWSDDVSSVALYVRINPTKTVQWQLIAKDYLDTENYPDYTISSRISLRF